MFLIFYKAELNKPYDPYIITHNNSKIHTPKKTTAAATTIISGTPEIKEA
jgi:hypothetical protein